MSDGPIIVITGPTASGKSALAIKLAQKYDGEIICADSRTIYRGMDIGTAKPTRQERSLVRHHLLDIVDPGEKFSAADFKDLAETAIRDIRSRHKLPFVVGGTGLYIDSLVLDYQFAGSIDESRRQSLSELTVNELITMYNEQHITLPNNHKNKRHLVNGLLRNNRNHSRRDQPDESTIVVAISTEKDILRQRIEQRVCAMFSHGVVEEAKDLAATYGWDSEAMTGNIYPILRQYTLGKISESQAIEKIVSRDWQLARRQITWLRRHNYIKWLDLAAAELFLSTILDRY